MPVLIPPPTKFVGLHCHSGFSVYDGLGYPADHIDFVLENGMNAWALTDHGNGSGLAHAHKHAEKLKKKGVKYRQIYGCEFYFVPSLKQWKGDYEQAKIDRAAAKQKAIKEEVQAYKDELARDANNTTLARFIRNLESRIYAELSRQLVDNMFGETKSTSGSFTLEGNQVDYNTDGDTVTLTINESGGGKTTISVPIGDFTF